MTLETMSSNDPAQRRRINIEKLWSEDRPLWNTVFKFLLWGTLTAYLHLLESTFQIRSESCHCFTRQTKFMLSLFNSMLWFTVSNTAERFRSLKTPTFWLSMTRKKSFWTFSKAISQLWLVLYADRNGSERLSSMLRKTCDATTRSTCLERKDKFEIGRYSSRNIRHPDQFSLKVDLDVLF